MEEKKLVPKLRFPGFTEPWEQRKLGDVIASLYNGQTPSRFDKANWEGDIPWLTSGELNRGVVNHSIEKITPQGRDDANLKIVPKGTVVIAITGLEAAGTRGNCAKLGFDTTLNQSCMAIYPKSEFLDPDFLFQWYIVVGEEYGIKYTQGTKQQSYNAELIKILPISVPRVTEQRKITRILDSFDDIITLHQRKLEHLKLKKKSLLQKLFPKEGEVYPEFRFPGFTDPWEQRKLGEIVKIERGGSPRPIDNYITTDADGLNWIKIGDAPEQGRYIVHAAEKIKSLGLSKTRQVEPGDLILSNSMSFGKPYIMGIHGCIHDGWLLIRNNQNIFDLKFLCNLLGTEQLHAQYRRLAAGSAVNNLNKELVSGTNVGVPSKAEQLKIGQFFESIDQYITLHQRKLEHLQLLKKALLQQLFV